LGAGLSKALDVNNKKRKLNVNPGQLPLLGATVRVLIAARSSAARTAIAASLIKPDCRITCVTDGDAARGVLSAGGIDICVIEPNLSGTSGVQLCSWIYHAQLTPAPYVILLSNLDGSADNAPVIRPGANEYFAKPVDPERLGARISFLAQNFHRERTIH